MINELIAYINDLSQGNEMIAGALTLALSSFVGYVLINVPGKIASFFRDQFVTSVSVHNTGYEEAIFDTISRRIFEAINPSFSRSLSINNVWSEADRGSITTLSLGYGYHVLLFHGNPMLVHKSIMEGDSSSRVKERIDVKYIGRSHDLARKFFIEMSPDVKLNREKSIQIHRHDMSGWYSDSEEDILTLDDIALNPEIKDEFNTFVHNFLNKKGVYRDLHLPYKASVMLHGSPGSGKTTLIKAIAGTFKLDIGIVSMSRLTEGNASHIIKGLPSNSILLIEDIDAATGNLVDREQGGVADTSKPPSSSTTASLSTMLNILDGISYMDGSIIFITTNHLHKLDPALYREGRVDMCKELPMIKGEVIKEHLEGIYGEFKGSVKDMSAKDLSHLKFQALDDKEKLLKMLQCNA